MRRAWLAHVAKIRKRENRGKGECSYREAMKKASTSWPEEKRKHERRLKREAKLAKTNPDQSPPKSRERKIVERCVENDKVSNV